MRGAILPSGAPNGKPSGLASTRMSDWGRVSGIACAIQARHASKVDPYDGVALRMSVASKPRVDGQKSAHDEPFFPEDRGPILLRGPRLGCPSRGVVPGVSSRASFCAIRPEGLA